jgi:tetratricopeptide (TPR) repeat protein
VVGVRASIVWSLNYRQDGPNPTLTIIPHSLFISEWLVPSQASGHAHLGCLELVAGNYQDAEREFAEYLRLEPEPQPYPILWNYLALRGASKDVEARALIERFANRFAKDSRETSLAELVQGKTDALPAGKGQPSCGVPFYLGMRELVARNTGKAREAFEKAKESGTYDYYECAAAYAKRKMLATQKRP